jgi:hypothetical protein
MILGATAFSILIINESTHNSLANGSIFPKQWYYTLHWIDTTIFVFAVVYVANATHVILLLCEVVTSWLARKDAQSIHDMFFDGAEKKLRTSNANLGYWSGFRVRKILQYSLIKRYFKETYFDVLPDDSFDFVYYIELAIIFSITSCFSITIYEWVVLFVACLVIIQGHEAFTLCCVGLLALSLFVVWCIPGYFYQIIQTTYGIKPHSIKQLELALDNSIAEKQKERRTILKRLRGISPFSGPRAEWHQKHQVAHSRFTRCASSITPYELKTEATLRATTVRSKKRTVRMCGIRLTGTHGMLSLW